MAGIDRIIYDIFLGSPGRLPDSVSWRTSPVKVMLERQHPLFRIAGDCAYPKSKIMLTPYRTAEAANDATTRLFNLLLCGMRTECTEDVFGKE